MALITAALLGSINNNLSMAYNTQFWATKTIYKRFAYTVKSAGRDEIYPRLDMLPGVREWIGSRRANSLSQQVFNIPNRKWEETITIAREDIEDDKYGMYAPVAMQMGEDAAHVPDLLVAQAFKAGTTQLGYDGVPLFSTEHQNFVAAGGGQTAAFSNYAAGTEGNEGPGWYLMDESKVLRPFIFQDRIPFELTARFNPEDPSAFEGDEFLWGIRGRCAAGFGLWQLIYYSTQELNVTNLEAANTAMSSIRRPDGTPMGVRGTTLVVPTALKSRANSLYKNELIANDPTNPTTLVANEVQGMFEPVEYTYLN
jgi:phage major head subunit gpT-like protein